MSELDQIIFEDNAFSKMMMREFDQYRENHKFCDWILKTSDGSEFHIHKIILASASPYFKCLFNSQFVESKSEEMILNFSGKILKPILDYIYSGEIKINIENLEETFEIASYFLLENLKKFIVDHHIKNNISDDKLLDTWKFADFYSCKNLNDECCKYISKRANKLLNITFLEELNIYQILGILKMKSLNYSEDKLYQLIVLWICNDYENRKKYIEEIFDEIRLPLLSNNFSISHIPNSDLLKQNDIFSKKIFNANKLKLQINKNQFVINKSIQPRYGNRDKMLFLFDKNTCLKYRKHNLYNLFEATPLPGAYGIGAAHTTFYDNYFFVCGLGKTANQCYYYCPIENKWYNFVPMTTARKNHGAVCLNNKIYVCGGEDVKNTEYFDLLQERWYTGVELRGNRSEFGICSTDNCIYIVGKDSIEFLDLREGKWTQVASTKREYSKACFYKNSLYCINGSNASIFNLHKNKWNDIMMPVLPGRNISLEKIDVCIENNEIYCYARYPDDGFLREVVCRYDCCRNMSWKNLYIGPNFRSENVAIFSLNA